MAINQINIAPFGKCFCIGREDASSDYEATCGTLCRHDSEQFPHHIDGNFICSPLLALDQKDFVAFFELQIDSAVGTTTTGFGNGITTQNLASEQLQALSDEVGSDHSLLVCCAAFHGVTAAKASERWPNLTLKKIPKMVLARCEWGHDDYSLNVANLPMAQVEKSELATDASTNKPSKIKKVAPGQGGLFGENE